MPKAVNQEPWPVPDKYKKMSNPTKEDGPKSSLYSQTDKEFFYKTLEGRKDMPSYKKKIPDENDLWALVSYMRTLK